MNYLTSRIRLFLKAILLISGILFAACSEKDSRSKSQTSSSDSAVASADDKVASADNKSEKELMDAPDFTLQNKDGKPFTLSDHEGKVVVLNVWATWCPPCRKEIPEFIKIQNEMRDEGVLFVGVAEDEEGWEVVRPFIKEYNINYPIVVDDGRVYQKYGPFRGIPTTFVINRKGKVAYAGTGMLGRQSLQPALQELINQ